MYIPRKGSVTKLLPYGFLALLILLGFIVIPYVNSLTGYVVSGLPTSCTETDSGFDLLTKGLTTTTEGGSTFNLEDRCVTGNNLFEGYCEENTARFQVIPCEGGCFEGTCKQSTQSAERPSDFVGEESICTETDDGIDIVTKGFTEGVVGGRSFRAADRCVTDNNLWETYCDGNTPHSVVRACPYGCTDGRCREEPAERTTTSTSGTYTLIITFNQDPQFVENSGAVGFMRQVVLFEPKIKSETIPELNALNKRYNVVKATPVSVDLGTGKYTYKLEMKTSRTDSASDYNRLPPVDESDPIPSKNTCYKDIKDPAIKKSVDAKLSSITKDSNTLIEVTGTTTVKGSYCTNGCSNGACVQAAPTPTPCGNAGQACCSGGVACNANLVCNSQNECEAPSSQKTCADYHGTSKGTCEGSGLSCTWFWDTYLKEGTCEPKTNTPTTCSQYSGTTQTKCENSGLSCTWFWDTYLKEGTCEPKTNTPTTCSQYSGTTQTKCENSGLSCTWFWDTYLKEGTCEPKSGGGNGGGGECPAGVDGQCTKDSCGHCCAGPNGNYCSYGKFCNGQPDPACSTGGGEPGGTTPPTTCDKNIDVNPKDGRPDNYNGVVCTGGIDGKGFGGTYYDNYCDECSKSSPNPTNCVKSESDSAKKACRTMSNVQCSAATEGETCYLNGNYETGYTCKSSQCVKAGTATCGQKAGDPICTSGEPCPGPGLAQSGNVCENIPSYVCSAEGRKCCANDVCTGGFSCNKATQRCVAPASTDSCSDNIDSGNSIYVYGTTTGSAGGVSFTEQDTCNGATLTEWYCSGNQKAKNVVTCANGCSGGACIQSTGGSATCGNGQTEAGEACDKGNGNNVNTIYDGGDYNACGTDKQEVCTAGCKDLLTRANGGLINCDNADSCSAPTCKNGALYVKDGYMNNQGGCVEGWALVQNCASGCTTGASTCNDGSSGGGSTGGGSTGKSCLGGAVAHGACNGAQDQCWDGSFRYNCQQCGCSGNSVCRTSGSLAGRCVN